MGCILVPNMGESQEEILDGIRGVRWHGSEWGEGTGEDDGLIWKRQIQPRVGLKAVEPLLYPFNSSSFLAACSCPIKILSSL